MEEKCDLKSAIATTVAATSALTPLLAADRESDILSWSRTQGLFAGVALEGATLRNHAAEAARLHTRHVGQK